jgi:hypothetical protein
MQTYEEVEAELYAFLTSALYGGVWLDSGPAALPPRERTTVPIGQEAG